MADYPSGGVTGGANDPFDEKDLRIFVPPSELPFEPCESCLTPTRPWMLEQVGYPKLCPDCAAAAKRKIDRARGVRVARVVGGLVVSVVVIAALMAARNDFFEGPEASLAALRIGALARQNETLDRYIDSDSIAEGLDRALKGRFAGRSQDYAAYYQLTVAATLYGALANAAVVSHEETTGIAVGTTSGAPPGADAPVTVEFELRKMTEASPTYWRVTGIRNAAQVADRLPVRY